MKLTLGIVAGITATMLAWILWKPALAWTFTHNLPPTHPNSHTRYRTWHHGTATEGPWA